MGVVGYGGWKEWSKEKLSGYDTGSEGHRRPERWSQCGHKKLNSGRTIGWDKGRFSVEH